jgi:hypothetical protein
MRFQQGGSAGGLEVLNAVPARRFDCGGLKVLNAVPAGRFDCGGLEVLNPVQAGRFNWWSRGPERGSSRAV